MMTMDLQLLIVVMIVVGALAYGAIILRRKTRTFSPGNDCGDDCGCSGKSKTPKIAH
jgi:hypothetical protein